MGGLSGHMMHLYDDPYIKFTDIAKIIKDSFNNEIDFNEKIDGFNLHASLVDGEVRYFRNKTDLKNRGMSYEELKNKYINKPDVWRVYEKTTPIIEGFILANKELFDSTPYSDDITTINCECVYGLTNVIPYNGTFVCFHNMIRWNSELEPVRLLHANGDVEIYREIPQNIRLNYLGNDLVRFPKKIDIFVDKFYNKDSFFNLSVPFVGQLYNISYGLDDDATLLDYAIIKFKEYSSKCGYKWISETFCPDDLRDLVLRIVFHKNSPNNSFLRKIFKEHNVDFTDFEKEAGKRIAQTILYPLKDLILYFSNYIIERAINYTNSSCKYSTCDIIKREIEEARHKSNDPKLVSAWMDFNYLLRQQINPLEGLTFKYNGNMYKLTGSFTFINRIIGTAKYTSNKIAPPIYW